MGAIALGRIVISYTVVLERTVEVPAVASSSRYRGKPIRRSALHNSGMIRVVNC